MLFRGSIERTISFFSFFEVIMIQSTEISPFLGATATEDTVVVSIGDL